MYSIEKKDTIGKMLYILSIALLILMVYFTFTKQFMWRDEYFTLGIINLPIQSSIAKMASDVHPPLYYLIVKSIMYLCTMFHIKINLITLVKLISIIPYALFLILAATKIRKEYNWLTAGLFAFSLMVMSEFFLFYQVMRMYSWAIFFTLMGFIYLKEILENNDNRAWLMLTLFTILGTYTHYFSTLTLMVSYLFLLCYFILYDDGLKKEKIKKWFLSVISSIILFIPWILILFNQMEFVHESFWVPDVTISYIIYCLAYITNESKLFIVQIFAILALIFLLALVFKAVFKRNSKIENAYFICGVSSVFLLIIIFIVLSYIFKPILYCRYLLPAISIFWFAISVEIGKINRKKVLSLALIVILILGLASFAVGYENTDGLHAKHQKEMKKLSVMNNTDSIIIYNSSFFCLQFKDTLKKPKHYVLSENLSNANAIDNVEYIDNETFQKIVNENTSNAYFGISDKYEIPPTDKKTKKLVEIYHRQFYKFE